MLTSCMSRNRCGQKCESSWTGRPPSCETETNWRASSYCSELSQLSSLHIFEDFEIVWTRLPFPPFSFFPRFCVDILFRTFLNFFHLSLLLPSLLGVSYLRLCVDILFRTFLDFYPLSSVLLGFLEFSPLIFFVILCPSLGVSYLRFCVDILFRTFLDFSLFFLLTSSNLFYSLLLYSLWFCVVILSSTFTYSPLYRIFAFLSLHFSLPPFFWSQILS